MKEYEFWKINNDIFVGKKCKFVYIASKHFTLLPTRNFKASFILM